MPAEVRQQENGKCVISQTLVAKSWKYSLVFGASNCADHIVSAELSVMKEFHRNELMLGIGYAPVPFSPMA